MSTLSDLTSQPCQLHHLKVILHDVGSSEGTFHGQEGQGELRRISAYEDVHLSVGDRVGFGEDEVNHYR